MPLIICDHNFCFVVFFSVIFDFLFFVLHKILGASIHGRCIDGGNLHNLITYLRTCLGVARTYEWTRVCLSFFSFLLSTPANGCCCRFRLGFLLLFQYRLSKIGEVFSDKIPIFVERPISKLHPEIPLGLEFLCAARERWFSAQIRGSIKCAREQSSSHPPTTFSAAFKRRQVPSRLRNVGLGKWKRYKLLFALLWRLCKVLLGLQFSHLFFRIWSEAPFFGAAFFKQITNVPELGEKLFFRIRSERGERGKRQQVAERFSGLRGI